MLRDAEMTEVGRIRPGILRAPFRKQTHRLASLYRRPIRRSAVSKSQAKAAERAELSVLPESGLATRARARPCEERRLIEQTVWLLLTQARGESCCRHVPRAC